MTKPCSKTSPRKFHRQLRWESRGGKGNRNACHHIGEVWEKALHHTWQARKLVVVHPGVVHPGSPKYHHQHFQQTHAALNLVFKAYARCLLQLPIRKLLLAVHAPHKP